MNQQRLCFIRIYFFKLNNFICILQAAYCNAKYFYEKVTYANIDIPVDHFYQALKITAGDVYQCLITHSDIIAPIKKLNLELGDVLQVTTNQL